MEQTVLALADEPTFDRSNGRDELNLAEFPLFYLGQRVPAGVTVLHYENEVYDAANNRYRKRQLDIEAGAKGLPTVRDADVLLAVLLIGKQTNDFQSPAVSFTLRTLINILGWDDSGASYQRVVVALKKWLGITLHFDDGWWDRTSESWETDGFHLIERMKGSGGATRGQQRDPQYTVILSPRFFASLKSGNIKKLNLDEYFYLTVPAAKQIYRFLDKRFYSRQQVDFDLRTFAIEHVGLSRNYPPTKIKEKLQPALDELEGIGFIAPAAKAGRYSKVTHGVHRIHFTRGKMTSLPAPQSGNKRERTTYGVLAKELVTRGVTAAVARELVEDRTLGEARIREKIELLDWLLAQKDSQPPRSPGGWLVQAIRNDYLPPKNFETKAVRAERQQQQELFEKTRHEKRQQQERAEQERREAEQSRHREEQAAVERHLARLEPTAREALIDAAFANPQNAISRRFAKRHRQNPGSDPFAELAYNELLRNHILPLLPAEPSS